MARYNSKNFTPFITGGFSGPKKPSCRWWTPLKITFIGARIWRWITTLELLEEVSPLSASHWTVSCRAMRRLTVTWSLCGKTGDEIFFPIVGSLRKDCPGGLWAKCGFSRLKKFKTKSHPDFVQFCLMTASTWRFFFFGALSFWKSSPQPEDQTGSTTFFPGGSTGIRWLAGSTDQVFTSDLAMISFIRLEAKRVNGMVNIIHLSEGIKPCEAARWWFETSVDFLTLGEMIQ